MKNRGKEHTTLTQTAALVVKVLMKLPHIKMIAPGEIRTTSRRKSGKRHLTIVRTRAGLELIITGQSVQKVAVHTDTPEPVIAALEHRKELQAFTVSTRDRMPGT